MIIVSRVNCSYFLPLWRFQDQQVGLTQTPSRLLFLSWILEHVRFCVFHLRVMSLFCLNIFFHPFTFNLFVSLSLK